MGRIGIGMWIDGMMEVRGCIGSMIIRIPGRVIIGILSGNGFFSVCRGNKMGLAFGEDEKVRWGER